VRTIIPVMAILLLATAEARAEQLSLREAIGLALENDHTIKAAVHEQRGATELVGISRSRYLPRVHLEEGFTATNSPTRVFMLKLDEGRFAFDGDLNHPRTAADFRTTFSLEQPLLDFSIGSGVAAASAEERGRGAALARRQEEVAFRVYNAYLDVQQARAQMRVAEQAVTDAREHLRLAGVRSEAGVGLRADELRARTFLSERELERLTATNNLRLAQLRLASAIGRGTQSTVDIGAELPATMLPPASADMIRLAQEHRGELRETREAVDRAGNMVTGARSSYLPRLYGTASYQLNDRDIPLGRDNDAWAVGAVLRWELFDGLRRGHEVERARAEQSAVSELQEQLRVDIALEVEEGYLRREVAGKRLEVARHAFLDAEETVRLVTKRFENSLATMVDLLDAQTVFDRSRSRLADAEVATTRATGGLYHAAGILLREITK
jgi:outer membrane protein TolC